MTGDRRAENDAYDRANNKRLDTLRREVCGTTEHQETHLELAILVKLHGVLMRAQNVYLSWMREEYRERSSVASTQLENFSRTLVSY